MDNRNLNQPASVSLVGAESMAEMAELESWSGEEYAIALANALRHGGVSLPNQLERLECLAAMGPEADSAAGAEISQNWAVLNALFERFSLEALGALQRGGPKCSEIAQRYNDAAVKAQRSALNCLSALKALRDAPSPTTGSGAGDPQIEGYPQSAGNSDGPVNVEGLGIDLGQNKVN